MNDKIKIIAILLLAGFSFFYTDKVTNIIKDNDPIMKQIEDSKESMFVSKIDPIIINDEYITGINGCKLDIEESYNNMKNEGEFKEELLVMKEDEIEKIHNKYIIGGNKNKRSVSIILLKIDRSLDKYIKKNKIKVNYFLDGEYIVNNIDRIIKVSDYSNIYNYGRNKNYLSKYLVYDNSIIETNFKNESNYCLFEEKNEKNLKLCSSYKMKSIKENIIKEDIVTYTKEKLENGKIFIYDDKSENIELSIKYIQSKGYSIVSLDELLSQKNECK